MNSKSSEGNPQSIRDTSELADESQLDFSDELCNALGELRSSLSGQSQIDIADIVSRCSDENQSSIRRRLERYREVMDVVRKLPDIDGRALSSGETFGDYVLIRKLGQGGFGVVWEAEHLSLERRVALKVLSAEGQLSPIQTDRIKREAKASALLNHPRIVSIYDHGQVGDVFFIAQELVGEGRTLHDYISELKKKDNFDRDFYDSQANLILKIAQGVAYTHEAGIIHRDLKPSNILLSAENEPKVCDFGLSKIKGLPEITASKDPIGTPYYMSPEQAGAKNEKIGPTSDVFSLGAVLYECLTLVRPFEGDSGDQIRARILHEEPKDPLRIRASIPKDLSAICMKALSKEVGRRYTHVGEFAEDLHRYMERMPIVARPASNLYKGFRWVARHKAIASTSAAVLLALFAWGYVFMSKVQAERNFNTITRGVEALIPVLGKFAQGASPSDRKKFVEIASQEIGRESPDILEKIKSPRQRAILFQTLGNMFTAIGGFVEAERYFQSAYVEAIKVWPAKGKEVIAIDLGFIYSLVRQPAMIEKEKEAERRINNILGLSSNVLSPDHRAKALRYLSMIYVERENWASARKMGERALQVTSKSTIGFDQEKLQAKYQMARILFYEGTTGVQNMYFAFKECIRVLEGIIRETSPDSSTYFNLWFDANLLKIIAKSKLNVGNQDLSKFLNRDLMPIAEMRYSMSSTYMLKLNFLKSDFLYLSEQFEKAEQEFIWLFKEQKRELGANDIDTLTTERLIASTLLSWGESETNPAIRKERLGNALDRFREVNRKVVKLWPQRMNRRWNFLRNYLECLVRLELFEEAESQLVDFGDKCLNGNDQKIWVSAIQHYIDLYIKEKRSTSPNSLEDEVLSEIKQILSDDNSSMMRNGFDLLPFKVNSISLKLSSLFYGTELSDNEGFIKSVAELRPKLVDKSAKWPVLSVLPAWLALQNGEWASAGEYLDRFLKICPQEIEIHHTKGLRKYSRQKNLNGYLVWELIGANFQSVPALLNDLAWEYLDDSQLEQALVIAERAVEIAHKKHHLQLWNCLDTKGEILYRKGDFEGAQNAFQEALKWSPLNKEDRLEEKIYNCEIAIKVHVAPKEIVLQD